MVVGAGSIGERYIRNLWSMGYNNIAALRSRNLPFRDIGNASVKVVNAWKELDALQPRVAFICTPTAMHVDNALECLERNMHVLVEKPLSHSTEGLDALKRKSAEKKLLVQVGYMMRFHPFLKKIYDITTEKKYGNLVHIHSHWGEYLPDWHPWEDYRGSYAAKKAMGGGVALTLSHDLDLSNWIAGEDIVKYNSLFNFGSSLEIDVEGGADFILQYRNGITAHVHMNYFQKVKERYYQYIFDQAVVRIDFFCNEMVIKTAAGEEIQRLESFDRNQLFLSQLEDFFSNLGYPERSNVNIAESELIIKLCSDK